MIQAIKHNIALMITAIMLATASMVGLSMALPASVHAQAQVQDGVCTGARDLTISPPAPGACATDANAQVSNLNRLITQVINIITVIVGVIAVIMIIFGGFRYITSGGDSSNVSSAKNTILYAIVGLIIVALAQVIVRFVLGATTSA
jgi:magnesium-transporting ATPase (P-type)